YRYGVTKREPCGAAERPLLGNGMNRYIVPERFECWRRRHHIASVVEDPGGDSEQRKHHPHDAPRLRTEASRDAEELAPSATPRILTVGERAPAHCAIDSCRRIVVALVDQRGFNRGVDTALELRCLREQSFIVITRQIPAIHLDAREIDSPR